MSLFHGWVKRARRVAPILLAGAILMIAGCQRVAPVRTLPAWVRGIHVPMIQNTSYEPALEEQTTRLIQEAFLADGRLDVVSSDLADLVMRAEIIDWRQRTIGTSGEDIADRTEFWLLARVRLYEPFGEEPLAVLPDIQLVRAFNTDPRSVDYTQEPDRKSQILIELANRVVQQTITGFPAELRGAPAMPGGQAPTQAARQPTAFSGESSSSTAIEPLRR